MKVQALVQRLKNSLGTYSAGELFEDDDLITYINFGLAYIDAYKDWGFNIRQKTFTSDIETNLFTVGNLYKVVDVTTIINGDTYKLTQVLIPRNELEYSIKNGIIETYNNYNEIVVTGNFGFDAINNSEISLNADLPIPFILEGVLFDFAMSYAIVKYIDTGYTLSQTFVGRATSILEKVAAKMSSELPLKTISIKSR